MDKDKIKDPSMGGNSPAEMRDQMMSQCMDLMARQGYEASAASAACTAATDFYLANQNLMDVGIGELEAADEGPINIPPKSAEVTKPPKLEHCVQDLINQGHSQESAYAICSSALNLAAKLNDVKETAPLAIKSIEKVETDGKLGFRRKFFVAEMKSLKNGDIEAYISTESIDRVGDIIKTKGWSIDNYIKTGAPVLFSHDYNSPPIGNARALEVQRKGLWSITHFHEKTQLSRDLAILARDGDMKSWSVGFNPLEEPESRTEGGVFKGYIFNKQELLEYSLVAVPANPEAISKAIHLYNKGLISNQLASYFAGPSPLAVEDSGIDAKVLQARQAQQKYEETISANYFLKGVLNATRR